MSITVDKCVYVCTTEEPIVIDTLASSEEGWYTEHVARKGRKIPRTADLPDGIKEPTKCNGEPMANTVSAENGTFAPGATHALAICISHPLEDSTGVHKTEDTDIYCVGSLFDDSTESVDCSFPE